MRLVEHGGRRVDTSDEASWQALRQFGHPNAGPEADGEHGSVGRRGQFVDRR
jgi:hypothetical protein